MSGEYHKPDRAIIDDPALRNVDREWLAMNQASDQTDLVAWLRAQIDDDERVANACQHKVWTHDGGSIVGEHPTDEIVDWVYDDGGWEHIARHDPARVLRDVAVKREMLTEHAPQLRTVEWDHDQNGKGEALCCPRCQNAEHSEWNPPLGQAIGLPEGFVTPYVLAPCRTLRLLASAFDDRPGYQEEWRP